MKIRAKLTFIQLILVFGFIFATVFSFFSYNRAQNLKRLEISCENVLTSILVLEQESKLLPFRMENMSILYEAWLQSYINFKSDFNQLINNPELQRLGDDALKQINSEKQAWDELSGNFDSIKFILRSLAYGTMNNEIGQRGLDLTIQKLSYEEENSETINDLTETSNFLKSFYQNIRETRHTQTIEFINSIRHEINSYTSQIYLISYIVSFIILGIGTILGLQFSRDVSTNIHKIESGLAQIETGNFQTKIEIKSRDEFEALAENFNDLSNVLWSRIDSLKDMMQDIGGFIDKNVEISSFIELILEMAIDSTGAESAIFMNIDSKNEELELATMMGYFPPPLDLEGMTSAKRDQMKMVLSRRDYIEEYFHSHNLPIKGSLLGQAAVSGQSFFIRNNKKSKEMKSSSNPESALFINSCIIIPLVVNDNVLGVFSLALTTENSYFTDLDYAYMRSYGDFVALTLDNLYKYIELLQKHELTKEIEVAADIQKKLLPERMPPLRNAQIAAFSFAAKGVSGDYYDAFMLDGDRTCVTVCDVAGKGVPASLLMIMIRTVLRTISSPEKDAAQTLTELNHNITGKLGADRFATIALFILDQKKRVLSYSNGAHHPLYIYRSREKNFKMFDTDGLPLGIDINANFGMRNIKVGKGDYIVLFTDGLPEARNEAGDELETNAILRFVANNAKDSPRELSRKMKNHMDEFVGEAKQHDDQTFLCMKVR